MKTKIQKVEEAIDKIVASPEKFKNPDLLLDFFERKLELLEKSQKDIKTFNKKFFINFDNFNPNF